MLNRLTSLLALSEGRVWHVIISVMVALLLFAYVRVTLGQQDNGSAMHTVAQIWKTLSNIYYRKGNVMAMMEIIQGKGTHEVRQTEQPVEQYANEMQYILVWRVGPHCAPLHMRDPQYAQDI